MIIVVDQDPRRAAAVPDVHDAEVEESRETGALRGLVRAQFLL